MLPLCFIQEGRIHYIDTLLNDITGSFTGSIIIFIFATVIIGLSGTRLSRDADIIADISGLGEAVIGAVLLGAVTSLSGITVTIITAGQELPQLAISHAFGGIAAQTVFLSIADLSYPKSNLEHAAASIENITQGVLLISMLAITLLAAVGPDFTIFHLHPVTPLMFIVYLFGLHILHRQHKRPMWKPKITVTTILDTDSSGKRGKQFNTRLLLSFLLNAGIIIIAGYLLTRTGRSFVELTGLSQSFIGGLFLAVSTSLPELLTSIAAVRRGALTLAIGGIIGGNTFDTLFAALADSAYTAGSVYHAITNREIFLISLTILMTSVLILGLLHRQKRGIANIGFEGVIIILLYGIGVGVLI